VGPAQGLQTAPSKSPVPNWPETPEALKPPKRLETQLLKGPAAAVTLSCNAGKASNSPIAARRIAAIVRNAVSSRPMAKPSVATKSPITVKDSAKPGASAAGASRCSDAAEASTIGRSGSTQGESVESAPAAKDRLRLAAFTASKALGEERFDRGRVDDAGR